MMCMEEVLDVVLGADKLKAKAAELAAIKAAEKAAKANDAEQPSA